MNNKLNLLIYLFALFFFKIIYVNSQDFWEPLAIPDSMGAFSILIDDEGTIFIGSGGNSTNVANGVFKSNDSGESWTYSYVSGFSVYSVGMNTQGEIFAGSNGTIFKSNDKASISLSAFDNLF